MKFLVTGGAGFIGSHLTDRLIKDGHTVRVVDNYRNGKNHNLDHIIKDIELIEGDILDQRVRQRSLQGVDVVLHHAAIPSVQQSIDDPVLNHLNGAHATLLLLQSALSLDVRRFIYASSSAIYGDSDISPKVETMLPQPMSPYAASKMAGENYCQSFAKCYNMEVVILRYFNVFGPRQDPRSKYSGVLSLFMQAAVNNKVVNVFGTGKQSRDFVYVGDVVQANIKAATIDNISGKTFNIGSGRSFSINKVLEILNTAIGHNISRHDLPPRVGDIEHSLADITQAERILGYKPTDFAQNLSHTLEWYRGASHG